MDAVKVGKQIATLRKEQGLTQKELAAILHITDGAVSKWERGINFPDLSLMEPLASALNTSVIQLLSMENAPNHEVANVISAISLDEKRRLVKELKTRAYFKIIIEIVLLGALVIASKLFADSNIYGLAQVVTMGMMGFVGMLIGSELYSIQHLPKLC